MNHAAYVGFAPCGAHSLRRTWKLPDSLGLCKWKHVSQRNAGSFHVSLGEGMTHATFHSEYVYIYIYIMYTSIYIYIHIFKFVESPCVCTGPASTLKIAGAT